MANAGIVILRDSDKRLIKQLKELGPRTAKKVLRRATNLAMGPALKQAKREAPKDKGLLKKSITRKTKQLGRHGMITIIGPKYGITVPNRPDALGPHAYGWIQERAEPFMEPSLENNTAQTVAKFRDELVTGMIREAKKLAGGA